MGTIARFTFLMLVGYAIGLWWLFDVLTHPIRTIKEMPWQAWPVLALFLVCCYIETLITDRMN